jgi:hypothetical protein
MHHKNAINWKFYIQFPILNPNFISFYIKIFYITIQSRSHQQSLFVSHFQTLENPLKKKPTGKNDKKDLATEKRIKKGWNEKFCDSFLVLNFKCNRIEPFSVI